MTPEDTQELKELIEFLKENNIGEFDLERGDLKVRIKFAHKSGESGAPGAVDLTQIARLLAAQSPHVAAPAVLPEVFAAQPHQAPVTSASEASAPARGESEDAGL